MDILLEYDDELGLDVSLVNVNALLVTPTPLGTVVVIGDVWKTFVCAKSALGFNFKASS